MNRPGRNDLCWCNSGKKYKWCHSDFDSRIEEFHHQGAIVPPREIIKNEEQIQKIRESAKINIAILDYVSENIKEGISTQQIDQWVYDITVSHHAIPAPLHFEGFPKSTCTSLNDQVCHGIPSERVILKEGDIVNVDVSTNLGGYFSDSSRMFCIGEISPEKQRLVDVAKEAISIGLAQVKPWGFLGDMGQAINDFVKKNGYSVVRDIGGHGIGLKFHEEPWVSYVSRRGTEMVMAPGMVFTVEPMINMGKSRIFTSKKDGWTVYTADGKPSAQWEVQILITGEGYEILAY